MSRKTSERRANGTGTCMPKRGPTARSAGTGAGILADVGQTAAWDPSADVEPMRASPAPKRRPSYGS